MCSACTATDQRARIRGWLGDCLEEEAGKLTPSVPPPSMSALVQTPTSKTGQPPTAATQRHYLAGGQGTVPLGGEQGIPQPEPVRRHSTCGTPQSRQEAAAFRRGRAVHHLRIPAIRRASGHHGAGGGDRAALGCRASEVLQLRVRDLDCGGTKLWVAARDGTYRGKTTNAGRDPDVPEVLRPGSSLSTGHAPDAYLFGQGSTGVPRTASFYTAPFRGCAWRPGCRWSARIVSAGLGDCRVSSGALSHTVAAAGAWIVCCDGQALCASRCARRSTHPAAGADDGPGLGQTRIAVCWPLCRAAADFFTIGTLARLVELAGRSLAQRSNGGSIGSPLDVLACEQPHRAGLPFLGPVAPEAFAVARAPGALLLIECVPRRASSSVDSGAAASASESDGASQSGRLLASRAGGKCPVRCSTSSNFRCEPFFRIWCDADVNRPGLPRPR